MASRQRKSQGGTGAQSAPLSRRLLAWYDRHARSLPWRVGRGARPDPYRVWLSEVMLQQTTVATVGPYFRRFLERWPTVQDLAAASLDDVLHAWQGLGYYARARNLHRAAGVVARDLHGRFPEGESGLRALPGVGRYTAAAIAAIAHYSPATVLDGNVERVIARLFAVTTPLPKAKPALYKLAQSLTPARRPGDYAQAIMDLGATVCLPRMPKCALCPWAADCRARVEGIAAALPRKSPKAARPKKHAVVFWLARRDGAILLRRRPENGLLGGLMELPSTPWREAPWRADEAAKSAPVAAEWRTLAGRVRYGFTHFEIEMRVVAGRLAKGGRPGGTWCQVDRLADHALPTLMKKVVRHALGKL